MSSALQCGGAGSNFWVIESIRPGFHIRTTGRRSDLVTACRSTAVPAPQSIFECIVAFQLDVETLRTERFKTTQ